MRRARRLAAALVVAAVPLVAQARPLTLQEAIELAFAESAQVRAGQLEVRRREGEVLRLNGLFDSRLALDLDVAYQRLSLIGAADDLAGAAEGMRVASASNAPGSTVPENQLPEDQDALELRLAGSWRRLLRSGIGLGPRAELAVFDEDLVLAATSDLSLDLPTLFRSTLAFDVDLPLRRGRGELQVSAELDARRLDLAADEARLEHLAERTALEVADAYWQAAAAAERLALFERAEELEREILRLGEGLASADQIPRAALSVTRARAARVQAAVAVARAELLRLRVGIAEAAGLELSTAGELPRPVDPLPAVPERAAPLADASAVLARAIAARRDLAELTSRQRAAELRAEASRLAARRRLDLALSAGWQGLAEGGGFTNGLVDSLHGELGGPFVRFAVELELSAGNRSLRGEELRARSVAAGFAIDRRERERQIRNRALGLIERLSIAVGEVAEREVTVRHDRAAVDADMARLALGAATLIDLVTTEELLTDAELSALEARVEHARILAVLQFELGALVEVEVRDGGVRLTALEAQRLRF